MNVLWLTERSQRHQERALVSAPVGLAITMLTQPSLSELKPHLAQAEILISERRGVIESHFLSQMPNLKFILRLGATAHDIDLAATGQRNIPVSRQPDLGNILVAEHCVMMMLALSKRLNFAQSATQHHAGQEPVRRTDENTFAYNWAGIDHVLSLYGKTVAILGLGDIGIELARRLKVFWPSQLLYNKRSRLPQPIEAQLGLTYASAETCYQEADILVSLLPFTSETDYLINAKAISQMKSSAFVVQAGSGRTIDENALADALQQGKLGGAALDTFEYEPLLVDHSLLDLTQDAGINIILTPHIAAGTTAHIQNRGYEFAEIIRFMNGERLQLRIDDA